MTRINLLPWRQAWRSAGANTCWCYCWPLPAWRSRHCGWLIRVIDQAIDRQVSRNSRLEEHIATQDSRIKTIDDLQERSQQLAERMKVVQDLHDARSSGARLFEQLARSVPEGVHLHEVVANGDTISIRGTAESNQDIARLMQQLCQPRAPVRPVCSACRPKERAAKVNSS